MIVLMTVLALVVTAITVNYFVKTKDMSYVPEDQKPSYASDVEEELAPETQPTLPDYAYTPTKEVKKAKKKANTNAQVATKGGKKIKKTA